MTWSFDMTLGPSFGRRTGEGEIEGRVTVFGGKWSVTHFWHPEPFDFSLSYA